MDYWIDGTEDRLGCDLSLGVGFLNYRNQSYRMIQISACQFPQRHDWRRRQSPLSHHYLLCVHMRCCFCFRLDDNFSVRIPQQNIVKLLSADHSHVHMMQFSFDLILMGFYGELRILRQPSLAIYPHSTNPDRTLITSRREREILKSNAQ